MGSPSPQRSTQDPTRSLLTAGSPKSRWPSGSARLFSHLRSPGRPQRARDLSASTGVSPVAGVPTRPHLLVMGHSRWPTGLALPPSCMRAPGRPKRATGLSVPPASRWCAALVSTGDSPAADVPAWPRRPTVAPPRPLAGRPRCARDCGKPPLAAHSPPPRLQMTPARPRGPPTASPPQRWVRQAEMVACCAGWVPAPAARSHCPGPSWQPQWRAEQRPAHGYRCQRLRSSGR